MTYRSGRRAVMKADRLDWLGYTRDDDDQEAKGAVEDIVLSPLLNDALSKPTPRWFYSGATIMVRLTPKEIGDDVAKVIANIVMLQARGDIVIYDCGTHAAIIHQKPLIAWSICNRAAQKAPRARHAHAQVGRGMHF